VPLWLFEQQHTLRNEDLFKTLRQGGVVEARCLIGQQLRALFDEAEQSKEIDFRCIDVPELPSRRRRRLMRMEKNMAAKRKMEEEFERDEAEKKKLKEI
jgi:hypothetical protein